jgi:drug/metabolite transporter (DMT)-like permease
VSTAGTSGAESWRRPLAIVLAILGLLAIVAGILYIAGAANSLHFMVGKVHHGDHEIRAVVSFVIGVVLLVAAWFVTKGTSLTKRTAQPEAGRPASTADNRDGR